MSFNAIRKNEIISIISELTVANSIFLFQVERADCSLCRPRRTLVLRMNVHVALESKPQDHLGETS